MKELYFVDEWPMKSFERKELAEVLLKIAKEVSASGAGPVITAISSILIASELEAICDQLCEIKNSIISK